MNLVSIRKKINTIDIKIINLLTKRQSYAPAIGLYKKKHNLNIFQKEREMLIMDNLKKLGLENGLDAKLIESVFKIIFKDSKRIQREQ